MIGKSVIAALHEFGAFWCVKAEPGPISVLRGRARLRAGYHV